MLSAIFLILSLLSTQFNIQNDNVIFYVSASGNDSNDGSITQPFQTLTRARDAVRDSGKDGAKVYVREGSYDLTETLSFTGSDSGVADKPNVWTNYPGEQPIINGSLDVNGGFTNVGGTTYEVDLTGTAAEAGGFEFIYHNGEKLLPARTPNWTEPDFDADDPYLGTYFYTASDQVDSTTVVKYRAEDAAIIDTLAAETDLTMYVDPKEGLWVWRYQRTITAIDTENREITLSSALPDSVKAGNQFWIEGASSLLSAKEFHFDPDTDILTVDFGVTLDPEDRVGVPVPDELINVGSSYFTWQGFKIQEYRNRAFVIDGVTTHVTFRNNEVTNGKSAFLTEYQASTNILVEGNYIHDIERGNAISIFGGQFVKTLTPTNNIIRNNRINNIDLYAGGSGAAVLVDKEQVGVEVSNNYISNTSRHGMIFEGNDHEILNNRIERTSLKWGDASGINSGSRDYRRQGTLIEGNLIKDIASYVSTSYGVWQLYDADYGFSNFSGTAIGIMLDDWSSGNIVRNNVVDINRAVCISNHGGMDNLFEDNYLVDCHDGIVYDEPRIDSGFFAPLYDTMYAYIQSMEADGYDVPLYNTRYPNLAGVLEDPGQGEAMVRLTTQNNLFADLNRAYKVHRGNITDEFTHTGNAMRTITAWPFGVVYEAPDSGMIDNLDLSEWQGFGHDLDLILMDPEDPLLLDEVDYQIDPTSAIFGQIDQLDISGVGPQTPTAAAPTVELDATETHGDDIGVEVTPTSDYYGYQTLAARYQVRQLDDEDNETPLGSWGALENLETEVEIEDPEIDGRYIVCVQTSLDSLNLEGLGAEALWGEEACSEAVTYLGPLPTPTPSPSPTESPASSPTPTPTPGSGGGDGQNPSVTIIRPTEGALRTGGVIRLTAVATDDTGVAELDFFINNGSVGGCDFSPVEVEATCSFLISAEDFTDGDYVFKANARDAAGNTASDSTTFRYVVEVAPPGAGGSADDEVPPTVAVSTANLSGVISGTVTVEIGAEDNVGVVSVSLYLDGVRIASLDSAPYRFELDTTQFANGAHSLQATATDAAGNVKTSDLAFITIQNLRSGVGGTTGDSETPPATLAPTEQGGLSGAGSRSPWVTIVQIAAVVTLLGTAWYGFSRYRAQAATLRPSPNLGA